MRKSADSEMSKRTNSQEVLLLRALLRRDAPPVDEFFRQPLALLEKAATPMHTTVRVRIRGQALRDSEKKRCSGALVANGRG